MSNRRPECHAPPDVYYDTIGAVKYANNTRMLRIQREMAERAIEILCLPKDQPAYLLDMGCGSGISGEALSDAGYEWIGCDISHDMLSVAVERRVPGDLFEHDLGDGLPFREGVFDAAISISTLQWLCHVDTKAQGTPKQRLARLFNSLFRCLKRGGRAVVQLYPQNSAQLELISECVIKAGFVLSILVDFPKSKKAKKVYLILDSGSVRRHVPRALTEEDARREGLDYETVKGLSKEEEERMEKVQMFSEAKDPIERQAMKAHIVHTVPKSQRERKKRKRGPERFMDKDWILQAKERRKEKGLSVPKDSKYTGRKRKPKF